MNVFLSVFGVCLLVSVGLAVILWPIYYLEEKMNRGILAIFWGVFATSLMIASGVAYFESKSPEKEHKWRGGAGPDTVCVHEERKVLVGKIVVPRLFTVCRP